MNTTASNGNYVPTEADWFRTPVKYFYIKGEGHTPLSNFWIQPFTDSAGRDWLSVEHFYQAHKAKWGRDFDSIYLAATPGEAKRLGRKVEIRDDWEVMKMDVMKEAISFKFRKDSFPGAFLLMTKDELYEGNWWGDTFWGVDWSKSPWHGQNQLGKMLMNRRSELRHS